MRQIPLPLSATQGAESIVLSAGIQHVLDRLAKPGDWPFRTAILAGPPRSGKSLIARWFAASGLGEAVDDADRLPEDELFHRWNRAQANGTPLLLVSSALPGEWKIALPDLASRLGAALLVEIGPPEDELLAGLIEQHAARRGLALCDGAAAYLLPRMVRAHAAAEALVETIDRLSLERKAPVTISLLREALGEQGGQWQPRLL
ncbi:ATPase [Novosphingobium sp. ZN18A2]|uniref:HdaA/DnaA family protein n=1 Tax=Novosphingobium sp. ZN18A2 TaxID=3079861 RepID=UPI0030CE1ACD